MTAQQVSVLQITLAMMALFLCSYLGGRVHQWYKQSMDRDTAFKEGYNQASESLFPLAARGARETAKAPLAVDHGARGHVTARPAEGINGTRQFESAYGRHSASSM